MSDSDAWYYTKDGQRRGPVRFSKLEGMAQERALDPRLDMVWKPGMEAWKPAGEIDGLFERRAVAEPESSEALAPKPDPYAPPHSGSVAEQMSREGGWPGARRRSYLFMTLLFPLLWNMAVALGGQFLTTQLGPEIGGVIIMAAAFVPIVAAVWFSVQRLANLGMSRWWFLANIVPLVNLWIGYRCFACPAGYAYHKKMDGAGIFLAIIYWLLVALALLAVAAVVALLLGKGDPELRQQIEQQIQEVIRALEARAHAP